MSGRGRGTRGRARGRGRTRGRGRGSSAAASSPGAPPSTTPARGRGGKMPAPSAVLAASQSGEITEKPPPELWPAHPKDIKPANINEFLDNPLLTAARCSCTLDEAFGSTVFYLDHNKSLGKRERSNKLDEILLQDCQTHTMPKEVLNIDFSKSEAPPMPAEEEDIEIPDIIPMEESTVVPMPDPLLVPKAEPIQADDDMETETLYEKENEDPINQPSDEESEEDEGGYDMRSEGGESEENEDSE